MLHLNCFQCYESTKRLSLSFTTCIACLGPATGCCVPKPPHFAFGSDRILRVFIGSHQGPLGPLEDQDWPSRSNDHLEIHRLGPQIKTQRAPQPETSNKRLQLDHVEAKLRPSRINDPLRPSSSSKCRFWVVQVAVKSGIDQIGWGPKFY